MSGLRIDAYRKDDLYNFEEIGRGSFGTVYSANLDDYGIVAVKCVENKSEVNRESNRLARLNHPKILRLIGLAHQGTSVPWLILEYMPMGNLSDYIRNYTGGCPAVGMIQMAHSIANGMDYLHRTAKLMHKDLAARNILVGENWNVKIGDFGLCHTFLEDEDYYVDETGKICPVRWMPPENLPITGRKYSFKGDIWSYGVVLFEMWSRGRLPYEYVIHTSCLMELIVEGHTPLCYAEVKARSYIIELMMCCWEYKPEDRPNFRMILNTLEAYEPGLFANSG